MSHRKPKRLAPRLVIAMTVAAIASGTAATPVAFAAKPSGGSTCRHCSATPTVAFTSPASGATLSGTVAATGSASSANGISSVQVSVDGGSWTLASGTTSWSASINTASYANGAHSLESRATDSLGNASTTTLSITISNGDTTPPSVSISSPAAASTVSGTVTVAGTAADNASVASVAVQIDGGAWQGATGTSSWSWSWDTSGLPNGTHTVTARATDTSGNSQTSTVQANVNSVSTTADTTPPTITIAAPAAGTTVAGSTGVSGSSSDNVGVTAVSLQVDGGTWQPMNGTASWSGSWDSTVVGNGNHVLTARAVDAAGNASTTSVTVNVSNSTVAPNTQGSWVSPEGVHIYVNTTGSWTISQVYNLLLANARDLNAIGPHYNVNVQDTYSAQTEVSYSVSGGVYGNYQATTWLQGANSMFSTYPDYTLAHEFGIAWTQYWWVMKHQADWSSYLGMRQDGTTYNGTTYAYLGQDPRLNTNQTWMTSEIVADDYRLLFASPAAVSERPYSINTAIVDPRSQSGLSNWLLNTWA